MNGKAYQYTFGTPWDVSTLTYDNVDKSLVPEDNAPASIYVKPDGTKFYTLGIQFDKVYQYSM